MTIVAPPRPEAVAERLRGTRSTVADLEALWAAPPRPSGDDLATVVSGAFPRMRRAGQDQAGTAGSWSASAVWTAGGLLLDGERTGQTFFNDTTEGRTFSVGVTLGTLDVRCHDQARRERAVQADADRRERQADLFAALVQQEGHDEARRIADQAFGRSITAWSAKSRSNMVRTFASLDFTGMDDLAGDGAMVTLTYPGDWRAVAPTGRAVKRHLEAFKTAWHRATGHRITGLWKLEYQRRGAPHLHLYVKVPVRVGSLPFTRWLSQTWAKIVGASTVTGEYQRHLVAGTGVDFGKASRMTDAKRLAVYFLKHGTKTADGKEYQHDVPVEHQAPGAGPGRFWGYWGLPKPTVLVEVDERDFLTARRVLRRMTRAHGRHVAYQRARGAALDAGRPSWEATQHGVAAVVPDVWTLGSSGALTGGWVLVNDGVAAGRDLARYLASLR